MRTEDKKRRKPRQKSLPRLRHQSAGAQQAATIRDGVGTARRRKNAKQMPRGPVPRAWMAESEQGPPVPREAVSDPCMLIIAGCPRSASITRDLVHTALLQKGGREGDDQATAVGHFLPPAPQRPSKDHPAPHLHEEMQGASLGRWFKEGQWRGEPGGRGGVDLLLGPVDAPCAPITGTGVKGTGVRAVRTQPWAVVWGNSRARIWAPRFCCAGVSPRQLQGGPTAGRCPGCLWWRWPAGPGLAQLLPALTCRGLQAPGSPSLPGAALGISVASHRTTWGRWEPSSPGCACVGGWPGLRAAASYKMSP